MSIPIIGQQKQDVVDLTERGAITMANFHMVANQLNWSVRCEKCGGAVQGKNSTSDAAIIVLECGCREYRAAIPVRLRGKF
jgi:hypothetical protein